MAQTYDLTPQREAMRRRFFKVRIGLWAFVAVMIVGATLLIIDRFPHGDEFAFPYIVPEVLAAASLCVGVWGSEVALLPGPAAVRISDDGLEIQLGRRRNWELAWSDPSFMLTLNDYRVEGSPVSPTSLFQLSAVLRGIGRSTLLSAAAFDAILAASRKKGMTVLERTEGMGTASARKVIVVKARG